MPNRLLSYEKIVKGECNIKIKNSVVIYNEPLQTKQELIGFVIILYTFHSLAIRDVNVYSACGTVEFSAMDVIVLS